MLFFIGSQAFNFAEQDLVSFVVVRVGKRDREAVVAVRDVDKSFRKTFTWKWSKINIFFFVK